MSLRYIKSFARRISRGLSEHRKQLFAQIMPQYEVRPEVHLDIHPYTAVHFELGFGRGERISALAQRHPDQLFIGCEPYLNGVSQLLEDIKRFKLTNVRIYTGDGRLLLASLPDSSLDTAYILFADPWPKARHHKRRVINSTLLTLVATKLKPTGLLVMATDHTDYAQWIEGHLASSTELQSVLEDGQLYLTTPPADWVTTCYEHKALSLGREVRYYFMRLK